VRFASSFVLVLLGLAGAVALAAAPTLTAIAPTSGEAGGTVTLTGEGLGKAAAVTFGKTAAAFKVTDDKTISVTVPAGATSGTISVTTPEGTATSAATFCLSRKNAKDGAEMLYVPAGEFTMGAGKTEHKVTLDGFWMYKTPVTVAQYKKFCADTGRKMPNEPQYKWRDTDPMTVVKWDDAAEYAKWAGVSLPTEAQWEKAARGTDGRRYPWGNTWDPSKCINSAKIQQNGPSPVGSCPGGESPYGLVDMVGNVWQWCADYYTATYFEADKPAKNPTGPATGNNRVMRGGGWDFNSIGYFETTLRFDFTPNRAEKYTGFRCVAVPAPQP
jgi:formylglycine-generating enzyme